ncbi:hypothetical protein H310_03309 [Aphanomyces invadans]|uniref:Phospholipid/glycerol acyltransferase domain-containing protein n=1 Tax=Aphanomyces invadans TaxID=157072 RepID=A0A024UGZ1_9STRA|nr:hypothetical protein H310_03309 [Aphanomyces invadans]ETW05559.1 hypothetical protein H310_03309 [Aphanomyces invadans]|eukprot:XP_008865336.1 hypothetical protein H310_03309 [Aphanomyces invadans]
MCHHQSVRAAFLDEDNATRDDVDKAVHPRAEYEGVATGTDKVKGVAFILSLFTATLAMGYFVIVPTAVVVATMSPTLAQYIYRVLLGHFCAYSSGVFEYLSGMEVVITGEAGETFEFKDSDRVLLISNHRTEIDWLLHWNFATKIQRHDRIMTMLKAGLRSIPIFGGVLQLFGFPFVQRNWAEDQDKLGALIDSYHMRSYGTWMAMFPEGTALYDKALQASHEFKAAHGKPKCDFVLEPRLKGFALCIDKFRPHYILDMTMAFPELRRGIRPSPLRLLHGLFPASVHFYVRKFTRDDIMAAESPSLWLQDRFAVKEEMLSAFYHATKGTFDKPILALPNSKRPFLSAMALVVASSLALPVVLWTYQYSVTYLALVVAFMVAVSKR